MAGKGRGGVVATSCTLDGDCMVNWHDETCPDVKGLYLILYRDFRLLSTAIPI